MDFYGISEEIANILSTSNTFFIVFFVCEGSMKIIAYGFKYYWYINWNKFDFIVVFLSLVVVDESWLENLGINASALLLLLFTFSIVGMSLFGDQPDGENFDDNANFKTFYNSMFLLFRCSTGESWNSVMHDTYEH